MAKYRIKSPDGATFEISAPDGASEQDVMAYAQSEFAKQPKMTMQPAAPQVSESIGSTLRDIPRQVGLTARYGIEGLGQMVDVATEPIRQIVVNPIARLIGAPDAKSTSGAASALADRVGLPKPRDADERVVGDAARMVASAGGMAGATGAAARGVTGVARDVLSSLAARPAVQSIGAASSGLAGGSVRESGGSDLEQFGAALAGGVAGGIGADKIASAGRAGMRAAGNALDRFVRPDVVMQRADQQIDLTLQRAGVDWSQVPERIKQTMREDAAQALANGQPLNADALRRLVVMRRAGVEPTVGQLTQNPGQITREKNLAKTAANSTDASLQRLPELENRNVQKLLTGLDDAGAANAPTASTASGAAIGSIRSRLDAAEASRDALYQAARDSQGRSVVLDGPAAAQVAARKLVQDLAGKLPKEIDDVLNDLTTGKTPLTVDYQQQLVRALGDRIRSAGADGTLRHGLGIVRSALDNADVIATNPGNLPVPFGTATPPGQQAGKDAIAAFQKARGAHRDLMARIEGNPALKAVSDGVEPDQFMQKFVIGTGATASDVRALRGELSPSAAQQMRQALVKHLKDKATGGDDDIVKFGGKTYRDELRRLSDKLPAFFSPEEIQQLRDIGDAAKYMQSQPAGSAVNNSNSGALMIGKGIDMLSSISGKLPLGLNDTITGVLQGVQQRQALAPRNALQTLAAPRTGSRVMNPLLAITASPPADARQDDRGR